jgi:hypothetical protein
MFAMWTHLPCEAVRFQSRRDWAMDACSPPLAPLTHPDRTRRGMTEIDDYPRIVCPNCREPKQVKVIDSRAVEGYNAIRRRRRCRACGYRFSTYEVFEIDVASTTRILDDLHRIAELAQRAREALRLKSESGPERRLRKTA